MGFLKYIVALLFLPSLALAANITVPQSTAYGQLLVGNASGGNYTPTATSSTNFFNITTSGSSGAATYSGGILNIPQYSAGASTFGNPFNFVSGTPNYLIGTTSPLGLIMTASSTIGGGTQITGLTVNGGATTTAYANFATRIAIGTPTPLSTVNLDVEGNASTVYSPTAFSGLRSILVNTNTTANSFADFDLDTINSGTNALNTGVRLMAIFTNHNPVAADFAIINGNNETARFTSGGSLGIATSSPYAILSVFDTPTNANINAFAIGSSTAAFATTTLFSVSNTGVASTTNLVVSSAGGTGTTCAQFSVNGTISSTGSACSSGSGSGTFSTTTSTVPGELINHPNNNTDIVVVGGTATTTPPPFYIDPNQAGLYDSIGSTSPFAQLSVHLMANNPLNIMAFAIGSSTQTATTTLFSVTNAGLASTSNLIASGLGSTGTTNVCAGVAGLLTISGCNNGTITAVSVATANGFAGSSSGGATPALTITTSQTGILVGNGTAITGNALSADTVLYVGHNGTSILGIATSSSSFNIGGTALNVTGVVALVNGGTGLNSISGNQILYTNSAGTAYATTATSSLNLGATGGGTGQTAVATGDTLYGSATNTWSRLSAGTNGQIYAMVNGVPGWVASSTGSFTTGTSPPVNYASTTTLPAYTEVASVITAVGNGALYIDGNNPTVGQTVLIKNETGSCTTSSGACNNGIYTVTAAGSAIAAFVLTRATYYNSSNNVYPGIATYVISGVANNDDWWALTTAAPITVGTGGNGSALTYIETSATASGVASLAQTYGTAQTGSITFATSSAATDNGLSSGLTITNSGAAFTFGTTLTGVLGIGGGGTNNSSYTNNNGIMAYNSGSSNILNYTGYSLSSLVLIATNASTTQLTVGSGLQTPNAAANYAVTTAGYVDIDTTAASSSIQFGDGTATRVLYAAQSPSLVVSSSTLSYLGAYGTAGTTTVPIITLYRNTTILGAYCQTDTGTANVDFVTGSTRTVNVSCSSTPTFTTFSTNNTYTQGQLLQADIGREGSNPNTITISPQVRSDQ